MSPIIVDDFFGEQYIPCEQCAECIFWEYEDDGNGSGATICHSKLELKENKCINFGKNKED